MSVGRMLKAVGALLTAAAVGLTSGAMLPAAAADEANQNTEWEQVQAMISRYIGEWRDTSYPGLITDRIPQTALLGNGDVGVASGGNANEKTFYISKSDFWAYNGAPLPIGGVTIRPAAAQQTWPQSLAQGKPATASSVNGGNEAGFGPARAVNGQWSPNSGYEGWVSQIGTNHWLMIDMQSPSTFDRIIIRHDQAARPAEAAHNTKDFSVLISDNGTDWTVIKQITGNTAPVTDFTLEAPVTARYIRLEITAPTQGTTADSQQNPRARIGQFEVYNTRTQQFPTENPGQTITDFYEKQDILNARIETQMTWQDQPISMKTFMAAGKNLLVTELTSGGDGALHFQVEAWAKSGRPVTASHTATTATVTRATVNSPNPNDPESYKSLATLSTKLIGATPTSSGSDDAAGKAYLNFTLQPGQTVYIVTAVGGGGRTYNYQNQLQGLHPTSQAAGLLGPVTGEDAIAELKEAHAQWWKQYWLASYIQLESTPDLDVIQKYYYAALYLLGCMCNEDGVAPGLYGIWHTTDSPGWNSDYHLNYNFIATFYGIFSSNRSHLAKSAVQAILDYVPKGEANAGSVTELRKINADFVNQKIQKGDIHPSKGIEGAVLYPVGIGPYGMKLDASYHGQTLDAAFSACLLIDYYEATLDEEFLQNDLYPYLKKVARFYEAWLEKEDGQYVLYAGYNEGSWATNAAAELAMLKNVLQHAIEYSEKLNVDADKRALWSEILNGLAPQPTSVYNGKTVYGLAELEYNKSNGTWTPMVNPVPGDGNIIPLESVAPADVFGYYATPEELAIAKDTIDVFSARGAWTQINNFPKIYEIAVKVRYPVETIVSRLAATIRSQMKANMMIDDNVHGAEKAGAIAAVNNMLLMSDKGVLKLFGNWLKDKDASFTRLRSGTFVVSASYDGDRQQPVTASVYSEKGGTLTVASLWKDMVVKDEEGQVVETTVGTAPNHPEERTYTFETRAGKTYFFEKGPEALKEDEQNQVTYGDVDHNGAITATDARLALQAAVKKIELDERQTKAADVDGNGTVNATDARLILQKAVKKIEIFPIEQS